MHIVDAKNPQLTRNGSGTGISSLRVCLEILVEMIGRVGLLIWFERDQGLLGSSELNNRGECSREPRSEVT